MPKPRITEDSPRLFDADLLETLSRTPPIIVPVIYVPIAFYLLYHGIIGVGAPAGLTLALVPLGMIGWTLTEYWLHRTFMHWVPEGRWGDRFHFWVHGVHHDYPNDPYRLVMPPTVSLILFFIFLGIWSVVFGDLVWGFHAGFTLGYVIYDLAHYYFHHAKPKARWLVSLQRHHLKHHFNPQYEELNFSITVPFWDRFFGTTRRGN